MLELLIVRHAKAEAHNDGADHERHLTERGKAQALAQGQSLAAEGLIPSHILCSPATRTRETCAKLGEAWGSLPPVDMVASLYAFGDGSPYIEAISEMGKQQACLMVIGHNPSVHSLALRLASPENDRQILAELLQKYPTCTITRLQFAIDNWADLALGSGKILNLQSSGL